MSCISYSLEFPPNRRECAICYNEYDDEDHCSVLMRKCPHAFGLSCIQEWVVTHDSNSCPVCREKIYDEQVSDAIDVQGLASHAGRAIWGNGYNGMPAVVSVNMVTIAANTVSDMLQRDANAVLDEILTQVENNLSTQRYDTWKDGRWLISANNNHYIFDKIDLEGLIVQFVSTLGRLLPGEEVADLELPYLHIRNDFLDLDKPEMETESYEETLVGDDESDHASASSHRMTLTNQQPTNTYRSFQWHR